MVLTTDILAEAAPGDLDPTFDGDGKVTTDFGSVSAWANGLAVQRDGMLVAAGQTYYGPPSDQTDFAVARYKSDGSLDPNFGDAGRVTTDFAGADDEAEALTSANDGTIVVAGGSYSGATLTDFAVARYNPDGSLDPTFGGDGKVSTDFASGNDRAAALAIGNDGKIVVAGYMSTPQLLGIDFALARYNPDGSLDPTFGGDGKVTTDFAGDIDVARGVAIQTDGRIVAAGYAAVPGLDFALARYNPDGSLDPTFGVAGKVTTNFVTVDGTDTGDAANGVAIQEDGRIVAAGDSIDGRDFDLALVRYTPDGSLDFEFGNDGTVNTELGSVNDQVHGLAIQKDAKIVISGTTTTQSGSDDFAVVRYVPDGTLDRTFGSGDGTVITDFAGGDDTSAAIAIQQDGKIVAAGFSAGDFALARYTVCRRTSRRSSIHCR